MPRQNLKSDSLQLQDRDLAMLSGLFECRVMTLNQIATLYFDGKREYTKKRVRKIKAAGLVMERKRRMNEPAILFLTRKAFGVLKSGGQLLDYPPLAATSFEARAHVSESTLRHELDVMDVKAAFHHALSKSGEFSILKFSTWPLLYQFETERPGRGIETLIKPDGFIRIHEKEARTKGFVHECFLEVDRSSEHHRRLISHAEAYRDYYRSGGFAVDSGGLLTDFEKFPFRVLLVLKSAERRNNTAERLAHNNPPILRQTWLTTFAEVTSDPLGPIWILPSDYRSITEGTPFYTERPSRNFEYHRRPEREAFVDSNIQKRRLLEG